MFWMIGFDDWICRIVSSYLTKFFIKIWWVALCWLISSRIVQLQIPFKEHTSNEFLDFQSDIQGDGDDVVVKHDERYETCEHTWKRARFIIRVCSFCRFWAYTRKCFALSLVQAYRMVEIWRRGGSTFWWLVAIVVRHWIIRWWNIAGHGFTLELWVNRSSILEDHREHNLEEKNEYVYDEVFIHGHLNGGELVGLELRVLWHLGVWPGIDGASEHVLGVLQLGATQRNVVRTQRTNLGMSTWLCKKGNPFKIYNFQWEMEDIRVIKLVLL